MRTRFREIIALILAVAFGLAVGLLLGRRSSAPAQSVILKNSKKHRVTDAPAFEGAPPSQEPAELRCGSGTFVGVTGLFSVCEESRRLLKKACELGEESACRDFMEHKDISSEEKEQGLAARQKLCESHNADSCLGLVQGDFGDHMKAYGIERLHRFCEMREIGACYTFKWIDDIASDEKERALQVIYDQCKTRNIEACEMVFEIIPYTDPKKKPALDVVNELCHVNDVKACVLMDQYDPDPEKKSEAMKVLKARCDAGSIDACNRFVPNSHEIEIPKEIFANLRRQCRNNNTKACGHIYLHSPVHDSEERSEEDSEEGKEAKNILHGKCNSNDREACDALSIDKPSNFYSEEKDFAIEQMASMCERDDEKACSLVLSNHNSTITDHHIVPRDGKSYKATLSHLEKRCAAGHGPSCVEFSSVLKGSCGGLGMRTEF